MTYTDWDDGSEALTLDEYRKLSRQQLRDLNDLEYGEVGGWDGGEDSRQGVQHYRRPRKICRQDPDVEELPG